MIGLEAKNRRMIVLEDAQRHLAIGGRDPMRLIVRRVDIAATMATC